MEISPGEVGDEDEETGEEGTGLTLESSFHDSDEGDSGTGVMTLGTTEVENNQTGLPCMEHQYFQKKEMDQGSHMGEDLGQ